MTDCPTIESLECFMREELAEPELARLLAHVEICAACQQTLHALARNVPGPTASLLQSALLEDAVRDTSVDADQFFQRLKHKMRAEDDSMPLVDGFEILEEIGRGGVGVVYRARQLSLNRLVALKMILAGPHLSAECRERFRREAKAVARLQHPNIVQVYEVGEQSGCPYLALELVEGGNLATWLGGAPRSAGEAAQIVATIAGAVEYAHRQGVIHRDLKPENILLTSDGRRVETSQEDKPSVAPPAHALHAPSLSTLKVADFGLAKLTTDPGTASDQMTKSGAIMGTPVYVAPEQARGETAGIGPAVDVYSLGVILFEILTGRPPFQGASAMETLMQAVHHDPVSPRRLVATVPRDLETICLKCLHKEPARRYPSARDLSEDLRRFLEGKPIRARPVGAVERAVKWARRRPAAALLIAALLVMAGAAVGTGLWMHQQEADRRAAKEQRQEEARTAIKTALGRANDLRRAERWQEALHVLTEASPNLAVAHSPTLEVELTNALSDVGIAEDFDRARASRPFHYDGSSDNKQRAKHWQEAFERAGLRIGDDPEAVAAHIRASPIRDQLVAGVDDRAYLAFVMQEGAITEQLLRINRLADPEPRWGDRFRDVKVWRSREQLEQLAVDAFTTKPPPPGYQLALLGLLLRKAHAWSQGTQLLAEACRREPSNFWVHREMGWVLFGDSRLSESAASYRIALALRPKDESVHDGLGRALYYGRQTDEAIGVFRRGLECAPQSHVLRGRLVFALREAGYWKEANTECLGFLKDFPGDQFMPRGAGWSLKDHGRHEEALFWLQKAAETADADNVVMAHYSLALHYQQLGRHEDAVRVFRRTTELTPVYTAAYEGLGVELAATGHPKEAITAFQAAIALDRSPRGPPARFYAKLGQVLLAQGRPEEAAEAFGEAVTGDPAQGWSGLAAARLDQGRFADARAATKSLLGPPADSPSDRALRRQLELCDLLLAVEAKLPAILAGKERPTDVPTQRALAEWCLKHKRLTSTAASYYTSTLAAQPSLADDREAGHRFNAACAAACAGCGVGADASQLDDRRREELRQQALNWLTAEYDVWAERHRVGKSGDRTIVAQAVRSWQRKDDLAGIRDEKALARLLPGERRSWEALWSKVATLAARDPGELVKRAREHVGRRDWGKAVACYAETLELAPTDDGELWFEYAASQLLAGDRPGYRRACAHMLACCQASKVRSYLAARVCTLAPDSAGDPELPGRLSQGELQGNKHEYWSLAEQAALHVREGRMQEATPLLEVSLRIDGRPARAVLSWLWLALANQKQGKAAEARRWLDKAANWLDQQEGRMPLDVNLMGAHRHNWLEAHVLRREAETLIQPAEKR